MKNLLLVFNNLDTVAPFITLLFFIKPFKRLSKELLYVFGYIAIQLLCNLTASILEFLRLTNYSIYVANIILSFAILSWFFYKALDDKFVNILISIASLLFCICVVVSISNGDGIATYNSIVSAFASFMVTTYCLIYFYKKLILASVITELTENTVFWIVVGLFTYYTGSFFIFISYKYLLVQDSSVIGILWRFHNVLLAIFCGYTIYGIAWKNYRRI